MYPKWTRPGASYVVDRLARCEIVDDLYGLAIAEVFRHSTEPGYVNVEWDNAIDPGDIEAMEACVEARPNVIWVATYMGYGLIGEDAMTTRGLGCTWLPRLLYERMPGLATVRYPHVDGAVFDAASRHNIEVHEVHDARVKHVHW
ncbi:MAG TPA: hypothetical protein VJ741_09695 [Solirubrobacteraceae bacterium]|nr:hypothetical protein [Solirubrobacteraceae bacterium]